MPTSATDKIQQTQNSFPAQTLGAVAACAAPAPAPEPPPEEPIVQAQAPAPEKPPEEKKKTWIEIMLVDLEGKPVPGVRYRITTPDGEVREGALNEHGQAGCYQIDPGNCKVTFPDLDRDVWS